MSRGEMRTWMFKREKKWIDHGIPCPEHDKLLAEIKYWVGKCTTAEDRLNRLQTPFNRRLNGI